MTASAPESLHFRGKVVLIAGAATGIGRATALAFARHGAKLSIDDVNEQAVGETLALVKQADGEAIFTRTDVSKEADVEKLVAETVGRFGRLDCAFNNAGIAPKDESRKPTGELDAAAFDLLVAVDLRGVFLCMKPELREMVRAGKGAIVNTASIAGIVAEPGRRLCRGQAWRDWADEGGSHRVRAARHPRQRARTRLGIARPEDE